MASSKLIETLSAIDADSFSSDADRAKVADALLSAHRRVQTPWEIAADHGWVSGLFVHQAHELLSVT